MAYTPDPTSLDFNGDSSAYTPTTHFVFGEASTDREAAVAAVTGGARAYVYARKTITPPYGNDLHLGLHPPGNDLHLGYEGSNDNRDCLVAAVTGGARAAVYARKTITNAIHARTGGARAHAVLAYDPNLLSDVVGATADRFRDGAALRHGSLSRYAPGRLEPHGGRLDWRAGALSHGPGIEAWRTAERASGAGQAAWREGEPERHGSVEQWRGGPLGIGASEDRWREGVRADALGGDTWMRGLPLPTRGAEDHWLDAEPLRSSAVEGFRDGLRLPHACDENSWRDGEWVGYVRRPIVPWVPPVRPPVPYGNNLHLCRMESGNALHLGYQCQRRIPRRRSYRVQHQIEITRLSDATQIPTQSITIGLDADSWAWTWSATLLGASALPLVLPSEQGEPVTLVATIDGHTWHLVVEDWQEDRAFGSRSITVSGRGLSAWLGAPYQPTTSGTLANARTLHQAMEELLPLGEGWTIDWADGTPDWLLPSGGWNWTNQAPIQAIHEAAQGVGLVVVPGMADRTLTVQPRYPILPWHFAAAEDPDLFYIPDSAILSLSRRQAVPSQANAVYVHGSDAWSIVGTERVGGIIALVWRTETGKTPLAQTVSDERITHVDGARLLGSRILAGQAAQPEVRSITLPLGSVFLLARIGELVALEIGASEVRGLVNSVSITADGKTVRQTITIGEDTPNVWAMWRRLLPEAPVLLGEILAIHEDSTRTVELLGGGRMRVRGESAVGDLVWIRSGRIEGQAPTLPAHDIEIF